MALGTPPIGSSYNTVGTGVAKVASDHTSMKVIVKPFAGPQAWMPLIDSGEVQLGALNSMDAWWAYTGGTGFNKAYKSLRVIVRGNNVASPTILVRNDSDIKSMKDLRGKRVASEYGGHVFMSTSLTAYLESVGLTWNDVKPVPVTDIASGLKALREGRVDACFSGSPDTGATLETDAAIGVRTLNLGDVPPEQAGNAPKDMVEKFKKRLPAVDIIRQPKEGWMKSDNTMISYPILLGASAKLSADAAYEITKALYENDTELHPIYSWLAGWKKASMFDPATTVPYHEGAIRYWKEKGLWTPAAEENNKKILGQ
ncbi:MAG: TAXI family TRAP transporter solute-binding subunit [Chloroflexi bacterium]|nr:TAXI family TRAP transporter solute-binding subunit [Chloroflexota bacterium]